MTEVYGSVSHWLREAGDLTPRPPLDGSTDVDVAVLGAGFTGLWTALELLRGRPGLRVAVVEREIAGFGASGRNGAWCNAAVGVTYGELRRRYGTSVARRVVQVLRDSVDEIGRAATAEGIDAGWRKGGLLRIARGAHEVEALRAGWAQREALGLADGCELLDAEATARRVRVTDARGALFDRHCATVHPGRLVRGLARAVERRGGAVYEGTDVTAVQPRGRGGPRLRTSRGDVRADTVVLAGEAWLARLPGWRRSVLPVYSLIVLTEPLPPARWERIGWEASECLSSHRLTVDYLSRTEDGRILFGGRGAPYRFGSAMSESQGDHRPTHAMLRRHLVEWFPSLHGVRFTDAWGGPVGMPRDWLPTFFCDPATGLAGAFGYTGQGVTAANLAGRVVADLITAGASELGDLPMVNHRPRLWEPEPLRWLAVRYLQGALARVDARARRSGRPPAGRSLAERLTRH